MASRSSRTQEHSPRRRVRMMGLTSPRDTGHLRVPIQEDRRNTVVTAHFPCEAIFDMLMKFDTYLC